MNKLKFKFGNGIFEFEVEGDDNFVKEKTEWATSIVTQSKTQLLQEYPQQDIDDVTSNVSIMEKTYSSVLQFLLDKKFASELDLTLGLAYYMEVYDKKESWNTSDLKDEYSVAKKKQPTNISRNISVNMEKAYIINPNRDDKRLYCLTEEGKDYIRNYTPKSTEIDNKPRVHKTHSAPINQEELDRITEIKSNMAQYDQGLLTIFGEAKGQREQTLLAAYLVYSRFGEDYEFTPRSLAALAKKNTVDLEPIQIVKIISANSKYFENQRRGWYSFNELGVKFLKETILKVEE